MVRQVKRPDEAEADLENTDELPMLDVAAYEAKLLSGDASGESTAPRASHRAWDESRSKPLAELPPAETLRDIEAWIATQELRAQTHDRVLAQHRAAHTAAQARADNLALELEVAQKALHTALCRANDGERRALDHRAAAQAAESRAAQLQTELEEMKQRQAELERTLDERSKRMAQVESQLASLRASIAEADCELAQRETERAGALDAAQRKLALELEWTRGALDERELQLRRLERYASTGAQVLSRIKVGIERENSNPPSETLEFPDDGATLLPLDDSDAPALPLGRHTTIGRAPESDLCLKDSSVSRRHAVVTIEPKGAFIEDVHSVNGVTVNRQRIRHARLADGDVIELGVRRFRFTASPSRRSIPSPR